MRGEYAKTGSLAKSMAGRDKGRVFVVIAVEGDEYVYLSDGDTRKAEKPKRKKRRHIVLLPGEAKGVAQKLRDGQKAEDHELRAAVRTLNAVNKEESACPNRM